MTVPPQMRAQRDRDAHLSKAREYDEQAELISEQDLKREYRARAAAARAAAGVTSP
jgi:hypothetical protein